MCWMGGDDEEKGRSAMHEVTGTGPGLYFRRVGCF